MLSILGARAKSSGFDTICGIFLGVGLSMMLHGYSRIDKAEETRISADAERNPNITEQRRQQFLEMGNQIVELQARGRVRSEKIWRLLRESIAASDPNVEDTVNAIAEIRIEIALDAGILESRFDEGDLYPVARKLSDALRSESEALRIVSSKFWREEQDQVESESDVVNLRLHVIDFQAAMAQALTATDESLKRVVNGLQREMEEDQLRERGIESQLQRQKNKGRFELVCGCIFAVLVFMLWLLMPHYNRKAATQAMSPPQASKDLSGQSS